MPLQNLTAMLSLLPPKPVTTKDGTFEYRDPNAAEQLNELRSVFDAMIEASPLYVAPSGAVTARDREKIARIVDPDGWKIYDNPPEDGQAWKYIRYIEGSLIKADAILALPTDPVPDRQTERF